MIDRVFRALMLLAIAISVEGHMTTAVMAQSQTDTKATDQAAPKTAPEGDKDQAAATPVPKPPSNVIVSDLPNDDGSGLVVSWTASPDDTPETTPRLVFSYDIHRRLADDPDSKFSSIGEQVFGKTSFKDIKCKPSVTYLYQVFAVQSSKSRSTPSQGATAVTPTVQLINTSRLWLAAITMFVCGAVGLFILVARGGRELKIRKIAGLEAVDEAVGRATEMGRSVLFVPGILDINDMQTVAGITVLSRVAAMAAEYDAKLEVPTARSLVMTTARETVQAAYLGAGRPDAYNEDNIYYLTDEQFGYVAGVTGTMVRDEPAACFYMGAFFAESLILAETGNSIGAIQVAGTAMPSQLPFFVAACDYTLIGEEFFAASAYLSGERHQLGSLKGQDIGKLFGGLLIIVGCLLATIASGSSQSLFERLDRDQDGKITRAETSKLPGDFDTIDENNDGTLDLAEIRKTADNDDDVEAQSLLFKGIDSDGDGKITPAEATKLAGDFDVIDENLDGSLDLAEISNINNSGFADVMQSATDYIKHNVLGDEGLLP